MDMWCVVMCAQWYTLKTTGGVKGIAVNTISMGNQYARPVRGKSINPFALSHQWVSLNSIWHRKQAKCLLIRYEPRCLWQHCKNIQIARNQRQGSQTGAMQKVARYMISGIIQYNICWINAIRRKVNWCHGGCCDTLSAKANIQPWRVSSSSRDFLSWVDLITWIVIIGQTSEVDMFSRLCKNAIYPLSTSRGNRDAASASAEAAPTSSSGKHSIYTW